MRKLCIILLVLTWTVNVCIADNTPTVGNNHANLKINHKSPTSWEKLFPLSNIRVNKVDMKRLVNGLRFQSPPDLFNLNIYQTPNRNQVGNDGLDTGACPAFAIIAAMEASYKRECMINHPDTNSANCNFNLSEDYLIHLNSQISTLNPYIDQENFSSYCGVVRGKRYDWQGGPKGFGSYIGKAIPLEIGADGALASVTDKHNFAKKSNLYHYCKETTLTLKQDDVDAYDYDYNHFSSDLRKRALYGVTSYENVSFALASDIEKVLFNKHEVITTHGWGHLLPDGVAADGNLKYRYDPAGGCFPDSTNGYCGGHAVLVIGYDRTNKRYLVKNSYGNGSNYWMPYYKNDGTPVLENGQIITQIRDSERGPQKDAQWIGVWDMDHDGWMGKLIIRRTQRSMNEDNAYKGVKSTPLVNISTPPRIGTYYPKGSAQIQRPVYGELNSDGSKLTMYIDFNIDKNSYQDKLGDVTGRTQRFDLYLFSKGDIAAGATIWDHKRFGSLLSRQYITIPHSAGSGYSVNNWKGIWKTNIDGVSGLINIPQVTNNQITGTYTVYQKNFPLSGTIVGNYAMVKIEFGNNNTERLNLFYHTREKDFVSGFSQTNKGIYFTRNKRMQIQPRFKIIKHTTSN